VAAGGSVVTFVVATGALMVLKKLLGIPEIEVLPEFRAAGYGMFMVVVMIAVQPAVFEELAFRGLILGGLEHVLNPLEAVIVSAALFMIIHLSVPSFPHLFVMGLALGWLRLKSGSLYPCMLLHFSHNLLCVLSERWRLPGL
jgi:membrane protease YdiL (CAAX protease family)